MCGIAAIFAYSADAPGVDRDELIAIRDRMISRGPDGAGEWISPEGRIGLAHRRLSIIDLSEAGAQPMWNAERTLCVTFNGEIYNYQALRSQLLDRGCKFHSGTDTEVLLHLYAEHGPGMVHKLRGMYAFAIWDARQQTLFCARDPFGIKPLYYANDGRTIRVASQVKALLQSRHIDTSPESAGHVGFFLWGHVPDPFTLYRGIKALPAGHTLSISASQHASVSAHAHEPRSFCSIPELLKSTRASRVRSGASPGSASSSLSETLRVALADTIRHHLIADVPVGVFQSGGLDSSVITAFVSDVHSAVRTVTLGFDEYKGTDNDEVPLAELVASSYKTDHRSIWVSQNDFENSAEALFNAMDQPTTDGVNTYFVSLAAKRAGLKVALSGLGGDELFGGYPSFREIPKLVRTLNPFGAVPFVGRGIRIVSSTFLKHFTSPKYAGLFEYGTSFGGAYLLRRGMFMPWELPELLDPDLVREGSQRLNTLSSLSLTTDALTTDRLKVSALELTWYMRNQLLRDADWAGMAHSLEIRVPLVDIEFLGSLLPAMGSTTPPTKLDMAHAPPRPLPAGVLSHGKTGFTVPVHDWLLHSFDPLSARERGLRGWTREVYSRFAEPLAMHRLTMRNLRARRFSPKGSALTSDSGSTSVSRVLSGTPPNSSPLTSDFRSLTHGPHLRALVLLSDGFGGFGGISKFNRDFLTALCSHPRIKEVLALPRLMPNDPGPLPDKLTHDTSGLGGKAKFFYAVLRAARGLRTSGRRTSDLCSPPSAILIFCGHINLLAAAFAARRICGGTVHLIIHGVDAWQPTKSFIANARVHRIDGFISVSNVTKQRFKHWSGLRADQGVVLPNCVDLFAFNPGPKPSTLLDRYGLRGKKVIMTLGRLASEERYKGFDEILEVLPRLSSEIPDLCYLICGDGADRPRLVAKARALGCEVIDMGKKEDSPAAPNVPAPTSDLRQLTSEPSPKVIFTGHISESEKADHYRVAEVFAMPSSGEGFGIVYLEALACGIPVIGSKADGSREALLEGKLGLLVDPHNPEEIKDAVRLVLSANGIGSHMNFKANGTPFEHFSFSTFQRRVHAIVDAISG